MQSADWLSVQRYKGEPWSGHGQFSLGVSMEEGHHTKAHRPAVSIMAKGCIGPSTTSEVFLMFTTQLYEYLSVFFFICTMQLVICLK